LGNRTALLITDVQNALVEAAHRKEETLERIQALLARARGAGAPVVYLQHDHRSYEPLKPGSPGWRIHESAAPLAGDLVLRKRSSDSFHETELGSELRARGVERLVITGMASEYCVDSTSRSALSHGFDVTLAEDAHTTVGGGPLPAEQVILHENETLGSLEHETHGIAVVAEAGIRFV